MKTLGWIGIGHMGTPMSTNLLNAGYKVNVYDISAENADTVTKFGAVKLNSLKKMEKQKWI